MTALIIAVGLVFVALAFIRPQLLLLVYIASLGWIPLQAGRNIMGAVDLQNILLAFVAVLSIPVVLRRGRIRLGRLGKFVAAYWAISIVSNLISLMIHVTALDLIMHQVIKDTALAVFLITLEAELGDRAFVRGAVLALGIAASGVVVTTLIEWFLPSFPLISYWAYHTYLGTLERPRYGGTLGFGFIGGAYLLGAFGTLVALLVCKSRGPLRVIALVGLPLIVLTVAAGESRATYIGLAVVALAAVLKPRQALVAVPVAVLGLYLLTLSPEISQRVFGRLAAVKGDVSGRLPIWTSYLRQAPPVAWLVGEGFTMATMREWPGHSSYVEVFSDTGLPGLLLFLSLWYHVLTAPARVRRTARSPTELAIGKGAAWAAAALLVSSAGIGLIVDMAYRLGFMCWLAVALAPAWELPRAAVPLPTYARKLLPTVRAAPGLPAGGPPP